MVKENCVSCGERIRELNFNDRGNYCVKCCSKSQKEANGRKKSIENIRWLLND